MKLKICGITNKEDVALCSRYADALGFIVEFPDSPRSVSIQQAKELMAAVPPFVTKVAVIPDFGKAVEITRELRPDAVQLHGKETVEDVAGFVEYADCTVIKACAVERALEFADVADAILLDDKYGAYDLKEVGSVVKNCTKPVILAGGLSPEDVLDILGKVEVYGLDVASGVESEPGKKDAVKVRAFRKRMDLGSTVGGIVRAKTRADTYRLYDTLSKSGLQLITEIKPASPSEGDLKGLEELESIVKGMEEGGASAISVLVEKERFGGSVELLERVRGLTQLPLLAKGFIYEEKQVEEVSAAGADAILLMPRVVEAEGGSLADLLESASGLKTDAVVEVASAGEMAGAIGAGARIIQVNNRDIYGDLGIDLGNSALGIGLPEGVVFISASGVTEPRDIETIVSHSKGRVDAVLVGTSIMKSGDVQGKVRELVQAAREVVD